MTGMQKYMLVEELKAILDQYQDSDVVMLDLATSGYGIARVVVAGEVQVQTILETTVA